MPPDFTNKHTTLPAGICSAPPYLHSLFNQMYANRKVLQTTLANRADRILDEQSRSFLQNPPQTGEALQSFMYYLLAAYKCEEDSSPLDLLPEITRQNYSAGPSSHTPARSIYTKFGFCEALCPPDVPGRELVNFITVKRMFETYFLNTGSISISVKEFCQRANSFFGIHLEYDASIRHQIIAQVALEKDPK